MDFTYSDDQKALSDLITTICAGRFPLERIRRAEEASSVIDADDWAALGEAGIFSLRAPESAGGVGMGMGDAAVVFSALGRALVPGPLVATHLAGVLAGRGITALNGALDGSLVVGLLSRPTKESGVGPNVIAHLEDLGALIVVEADQSLSLVDPKEIEAHRLERSLDPLTPLFALDQLPQGEPIPGGKQVGEELVRDHHILTGALLAGIAQATTTMAVDYAKARRQFGRAIGSFQAIKHLCADMITRAEVAICGVEAAAVNVDQPDVGNVTRASASAALYAAEAAIKNAKTAIQIHGGMGFTWEVPVHLYLTRARLLASSLSDRETLALRVSSLL